MNRTFTLDETDHLRHKIFRRYGDQHMDMIRSEMSLQNLAFSLRCESSKY